MGHRMRLVLGNGARQAWACTVIAGEQGGGVNDQLIKLEVRRTARVL